MLCHWDDVEPEAIDRGELRGERRRLGSAAGAVRTGLSRYRLPAGAPAMPVHVHGDEEEIFFVLGGEGLSWQDVAPGFLSNPPHCHSAEEELFVVLDGDGVLLLDGEDDKPVRAGHVVSRPAGTGVAHAFRAGERGLTLLAHGRHDPSDICLYPRSGKLSVRGVRAIFRIERVDYWDGEA